MIMTTIDVPTADEPVSAAEANRQFSTILRGVREGRSYLVTSHGRPVARIVPPTATTAATNGARDVLIDRLRRQIPVDIGRWSRDEMYEDDA